jgi:hypothetical protein
MQCGGHPAISTPVLKTAEKRTGYFCKPEAIELFVSGFPLIFG